MTVHDRDPVLRRKLVPRTPPPSEEASARIGRAPGLARSLGKAVSAAAPLVAEEPALHHKKASLAELLDGIDPDAFVTLLGGAEGAPALALIDHEGFATVIEAMTIGRLGARAPAVRRPTTTDAALLGELLDATLRGLGAEDPVSALRCSRAVPDHRLLPVLLDDIDHDLVVLTAVLVSGSVTRPLRLMLALPCLPKPEVENPGNLPPPHTWSNALEEAVLRAPASLRAELGRVTLPLDAVMALGPGSSLILPLSNLEEVKLVSLDGTTQAIGRLGQTRGMRAVRLTGWPGGMPQPGMIDAAPRTPTTAGFTTAPQATTPVSQRGDDEDADEAADMSFPAMAPMSLSLDDD